MDNTFTYVFPPAFMLLGILFIVIAAYVYRRQKAFVSRSLTSSGTVVDFVERALQGQLIKHKFSVVRFTPIVGGDEVTFESNVGSSFAPTIGKIVRVRYDLENPHSAQIDSTLMLWGIPILFGIIGGLLFVVGLALMIAFVLTGALTVEGFFKLLD